MKLKVLDLFCGAGGLSLGFQLAGYEIVGGIDFYLNRTTQKVYLQNIRSG